MYFDVRALVAMLEDDLPKFRELISPPDFEVDVNLKFYKGENILYIICEQNKIEFARHLLTLPQTKVDLAALKIACAKNHCEIARSLLSHPSSADMKVMKKDHKAPFHSACEAGSLEAMKLLLEFNHDPLITTEKGTTPLHLACERDRGEIVEHMVTTIPEVRKYLFDQPWKEFAAAASERGVKQTIESPLHDAVRGYAMNALHALLRLPLFTEYPHLLTESFATILRRSEEKNTDNYHLARLFVFYCPDFSPYAVANMHNKMINTVSKDPRMLSLVRSSHSDAYRDGLALDPLFRQHQIGLWYAAIVMLSDGLFEVDVNRLAAFRRESFDRFFKLITRLPIEMQMIVTNRLFNSWDDLVPVADASRGFKWHYMWWCC